MDDGPSTDMLAPTASTHRDSGRSCEVLASVVQLVRLAPSSETVEMVGGRPPTSEADLVPSPPGRLDVTRVQPVREVRQGVGPPVGAGPLGGALLVNRLVALVKVASEGPLAGPYTTPLLGP